MTRSLQYIIIEIKFYQYISKIIYKVRSQFIVIRFILILIYILKFIYRLIFIYQLIFIYKILLFMYII